ncbi:hypothetical protein Tco_0479835, partial [Tanacetum coccineum]
MKTTYHTTCVELVSTEPFEKSLDIRVGSTEPFEKSLDI